MCLPYSPLLYEGTDPVPPLVAAAEENVPPSAHGGLWSARYPCAPRHASHAIRDGTHSSRGSSWTASVPRASVEASGQSADAVCSRSRFNKYCSCASSACTPSRPHARRLAGAALHVFARVTSCACVRA